MNNTKYPVHGAGLGLRRAIMGPLSEAPPQQVDFMEVAPENWIGIGGSLGKRFAKFTEAHPFVCHGLSLSIGSPSPLDFEFLKKLKQFLDQHKVRSYSEHLSYCSDHGHLYDLMPIPFTEEAVHYVADRIRTVQDVLERQIVMENISYYAAPGKELDEIKFINAVLEESDCGLLLDVNNIFVNSINHKYDPKEFLLSLPADRIAYFHIAGHYDEAEDLKVDTHGSDVKESVWDLLELAYEHFGVVPTLLERDFNIPPIPELLSEVDKIAELQSKWSKQGERQSAQN